MSSLTLIDPLLVYSASRARHELIGLSSRSLFWLHGRTQLEVSHHANIGGGPFGLSAGAIRLFDVDAGVAGSTRPLPG